MVKILIILWKLMLSENFIRFWGAKNVLIVYSKNVLTKALNKPFKNNELEKNVSKIKSEKDLFNFPVLELYRLYISIDRM